ncbi:MAG TPA: hypothetical protein VF077_13235 [Nitrospiraceae bacterium]
MKCTLLIGLGFIVLASGCASSGIVQSAADAEDQALQTSLWTMCQAISVGAWERAFGQDKQAAQAWKELCRRTISEAPVK